MQNFHKIGLSVFPLLRSGAGGAKERREESVPSLRRLGVERASSGGNAMKISILELRRVAEILEVDAARVCLPEDLPMLENVADYLRFVANQREEYEARRREEDPRMKKLKSALSQLRSARRIRLAGQS